MRINLIVLLFLVVCGCGHNRVNEYRSTGATGVIPLGDLGALCIGVGSTEYTTAMVRGGSSYTTETAAGAGLLSGAAGSSRVTTFKSNTQINEGNLEKLFSSSNVTDAVKIELAKGLAKEMKAPELQTSVLQTREAVIYSNGITNEFSYPFKPTGVDKLSGDVTKVVADVVEDVADASKEIINNTVDNVSDTVDNSVDSVVEATDNMTKFQAIGLLITIILAGIVTWLGLWRNKTTACPKCKTDTDEIVPPNIDDDSGDRPGDDSGSQPTATSDETPSERKPSKIETAIDAAIDVLHIWNKLPKKQKQMVKQSVSVIATPKKN